MLGGDVRRAGHQGHILAGVVADGGGVGRELVPLVAGEVPQLELDHVAPPGGQLAQVVGEHLAGPGHPLHPQPGQVLPARPAGGEVLEIVL